MAIHLYGNDVVEASVPDRFRTAYTKGSEGPGHEPASEVTPPLTGNERFGVTLVVFVRVLPDPASCNRRDNQYIAARLCV